MKITRRLVSAMAALGVAASLGGAVAGQIGSRPTPDWIERLERPERVAGLKIDYIISKLDLRPGQVVADVGAGSGLLSVPIAKAVSPGGKVYAVEVDRPFLDRIETRAREQRVTNITTVLGKFTDPALPARDVDLALFHDVLHHIEDRAGYLKAVVRYLKPAGRVAIIDLPSDGSHKDEPALVVTKDQAKAWMAAAGFTPVQDIEGLADGKWFVVYGRTR
jgi:ubiquinone/menaquinone biosynthesis C-methylase UbiE